VFANSGQVCSAGSRLLVEDSVSDEFLDALQRAAEGIRVGGGFDPTTQLGPVDLGASA
jgi:betaine-aldehyde dehydrogenase